MLNITEFTMLPQQAMVFRVPRGSIVIGLRHDRPFPRLQFEGFSSVLFDELRVFRIVTPIDDPFDTKGWQHIHTSLAGGEEPRDMWMVVHVWELNLDSDLDSLEIERQLLDRP